MIVSQLSSLPFLCWTTRTEPSQVPTSSTEFDSTQIADGLALFWRRITYRSSSTSPLKGRHVHRRTGPPSPPLPQEGTVQRTRMLAERRHSASALNLAVVNSHSSITACRGNQIQVSQVHNAVSCFPSAAKTHSFHINKRTLRTRSNHPE